MSVLDQLKKLDEQRAQLLDGAKVEALAKVESAIAELNALGFAYELVEGGVATRKRSSKGSSVGIKRPMSDQACPICGFKTEPLHDGRAHKSQVKKKAFTAEELKDKGLKSV